MDAGDIQHVRECIFFSFLDFEIFPRCFLRHSRCERTKTFSFFDDTIDSFAHRRGTGVGQNTAITKSTGPEFHPVLKPATGLTLRQAPCGLFNKIVEPLEPEFTKSSWNLNFRLNLFIAEGGTP